MAGPTPGGHVRGGRGEHIHPLAPVFSAICWRSTMTGMDWPYMRLRRLADRVGRPEVRLAACLLDGDVLTTAFQGLRANPTHVQEFI